MITEIHILDSIMVHWIMRVIADSRFEPTRVFKFIIIEFSSFSQSYVPETCLILYIRSKTHNLFITITVS